MILILCIFYTIKKVYLVEMKCRYLSDGARNIMYDAIINDHLIFKHGFRKVYYRLLGLSPHNLARG